MSIERTDAFSSDVRLLVGFLVFGCCASVCIFWIRANTADSSQRFVFLFPLLTLIGLSPPLIRRAFVVLADRPKSFAASLVVINLYSIYTPLAKRIKEKVVHPVRTTFYLAEDSPLHLGFATYILQSPTRTR